MDWREQEEESPVPVVRVGWRAYLKVVWEQTLNVLTFGAIARVRAERVKQMVAMEALAAQMAPASTLPEHTHDAQAPHDAPLTPVSTASGTGRPGGAGKRERARKKRL